jgi:hypothetical protein
MTDQQLEAAAAPAPRPAPPEQLVPAVQPPAVEHAIRLVERGPFVAAVCTGCGWETFARRSRPLARREGHDHVLLHAPAGSAG